MGKQDGQRVVKPTLVQHSSSIALLQERFRRLERIKEMREEREHLRVVFPPEPELEETRLRLRRRWSSTGSCYGQQQVQPRWFFYSDTVFPSQLPLLISRPNKYQHSPSPSKENVELCASDASLSVNYAVDEKGDSVDTSLHL
ncbi:hypothetical protein ZOSMA_218G00020 [Zostera marina]|uniref:Uncharacterized protein n=1 Tax=Zostera marina TaxID=29655 RepID=A0A0K9PM31_ZOSMR|nr:hypothetical protein ZOSMA_218G00020 [Zostera marina]